jgi:hypothetical protein
LFSGAQTRSFLFYIHTAAAAGSIQPYWKILQRAFLKKQKSAIPQNCKKSCVGEMPTFLQISEAIP